MSLFVSLTTLCHPTQFWLDLGFQNLDLLIVQRKAGLIKRGGPASTLKIVYHYGPDIATSPCSPKVDTKGHHRNRWLFIFYLRALNALSFKEVGTEIGRCGIEGVHVIRQFVSPPYSIHCTARL